MDSRSFDLFDLQIFQTVAKVGSFSSAAELIDLPLSTVSRRVKQLEARAEARLFERTSRGLKLTESGEFLLKSSDNILREFDSAFSNLNKHNSDISGRVVVYSPPSTFTHLFPDFLLSFSKKYPAIEIDIVTAMNDICFTDKRIDVFLHPGSLPDSNVIARHLFDTKLDYFVSRDYVKAHGMPTLENMKEHKFVCFSPFIKNPSFWGFNAENPLLIHKPNIISDDFLLCAQQIKAGAGIGCLPYEFLQNQDTFDNLLPLFEGRFRRTQPSYAVLSSNRYVPNKVKVFVDAFIEHVQQSSHK